MRGMVWLAGDGVNTLAAVLPAALRHDDGQGAAVPVPYFGSSGGLVH